MDVFVTVRPLIAERVGATLDVARPPSTDIVDGGTLFRKVGSTSETLGLAGSNNRGQSLPLAPRICRSTNGPRPAAKSSSADPTHPRLLVATTCQSCGSGDQNPARSGRSTANYTSATGQEATIVSISLDWSWGEDGIVNGTTPVPSSPKFLIGLQTWRVPLA
jgi:hypothetical protein